MVGLMGLPSRSILHDVLFICSGSYTMRSVMSTADVSPSSRLRADHSFASSDITCCPVGAEGIPLARSRPMTVRLTREMSCLSPTSCGYRRTMSSGCKPHCKSSYDLAEVVLYLLTSSVIALYHRATQQLHPALILPCLTTTNGIDLTQALLCQCRQAYTP